MGMPDDLAKQMGLKASWRTLTGRSDGKAYVSATKAKARVKKYRKERPDKKFRIRPNYHKTLWAVEWREWY